MDSGTALTMTKQPFCKYTPTQNGVRDIEEALAEVQREMDVRRKIYDKWVADGRMSWMDAHDRMERIMSALRHLISYSKELDKANPVHNNPHSFDTEGVSLSTLDNAAAAA